MKKIWWFIVFCFVFCVSNHLEAAGFTKYKGGISLLDGKIVFGGRFRFRQEIKDAYYVPDGKRKVHDDLSLFQTRLYVEFKPKDEIGFHLMFEDARDFTEPHPYKSLVPYAYDTAFDVQQAYIYYEPKERPLSMWAGRREVFYLKHRLIGTTIGWGNKVITYDGAMVTIKNKNFDIDISYLNWVRPQHTGRPFEHTWFSDPANIFLVWATLKNIYPNGNIEVYTIYDDRHNGEDVYTMGFRTYGRIGEPFNYDIDANLQWGDKLIDNSFYNRIAGSFYLDISYNFGLPLNPSLGMEYFMATGDSHPKKGNYNTFDQLYATPHYSYGYMDLMGWQNMHDLNLKGTIRPFKGFKFSTSLHTFWLFANEDAWYNAYKKIQRYGREDASHYVGNEMDFIFFYNFLKNFTLIGTYSHFFAGRFVAQTGQSNDADFFSMEIRFEL